MRRRGVKHEEVKQSVAVPNDPEHDHHAPIAAADRSVGRVVVIVIIVVIAIIIIPIAVFVKVVVVAAAAVVAAVAVAVAVACMSTALAAEASHAPNRSAAARSAGGGGGGAREARHGSRVAERAPGLGAVRFSSSPPRRAAAVACTSSHHQPPTSSRCSTQWSPYSPSAFAPGASTVVPPPSTCICRSAGRRREEEEEEEEEDSEGVEGKGRRCSSPRGAQRCGRGARRPVQWWVAFAMAAHRRRGPGPRVEVEHRHVAQAVRVVAPEHDERCPALHHRVAEARDGALRIVLLVLLVLLLLLVVVVVVNLLLLLLLLLLFSSSSSSSSSPAASRRRPTAAALGSPPLPPRSSSAKCARATLLQRSAVAVAARGVRGEVLGRQQTCGVGEPQRVRLRKVPRGVLRRAELHVRQVREHIVFQRRTGGGRGAYFSRASPPERTN